MDLTRDDRPYITSLEIGDRFDGHLILRTLQLGMTRTNKPFLIMDFTDRTGHIKGKMWEDAEAAYRSLKEGVVVKIRAAVEEYLGKPELKVVKIRPIDPADIEDYSRFLPTSDRDPEELWATIRWSVERVGHEGLKALLDGFLEDEEFVERFQRAPAGKKWHHAYIGGLLEHTASMIKLVERLADHYPYLDRDLLVSGTVLHDIGKVWELRYDTTIDYTRIGRLEGHIFLGAEEVSRRAESIEELDEETLTRLRHLILSHQGTREQGSPVLPMTREAFILYFVDEIDSKLNAIGREMDKASGGGGEFTEYVRLLDRMLYKGANPPEQGID